MPFAIRHEAFSLFMSWILGTGLVLGIGNSVIHFSPCLPQAGTAKTPSLILGEVNAAEGSGNRKGEI